MSVSVVIPAYNASLFIRRTVESVRRQTSKDWELIVVDDGSQDDTRAAVLGLVKEWGINGRCISQRNRGIAGARNTGIRDASGQYVAFLDHDDLWHPTKLARVLSVFATHPEVGLVCHDEHVIWKGKIVTTNRYGSYSDDMHEYLLFKGNCLSPSATVVRRQLLIQARGFNEDTDLHTVEDYDLWIRLSRLTRFHRLQEVLGEYVLRESSALHNVESHYENLVRMTTRHLHEVCGPNPSLRNVVRIRRRRAALYRSASLAVMKSARQPERRWLYLQKALRNFPFDPLTLAAAAACVTFPLINLTPLLSAFAEKWRLAKHLATSWE